MAEYTERQKVVCKLLDWDAWLASLLPRPDSVDAQPRAFPVREQIEEPAEVHYAG